MTTSEFSSAFPEREAHINIYIYYTAPYFIYYLYSPRTINKWVPMTSNSIAEASSWLHIKMCRSGTPAYPPQDRAVNNCHKFAPLSAGLHCTSAKWRWQWLWCWCPKPTELETPAQLEKSCVNLDATSLSNRPEKTPSGVPDPNPTETGLFKWFWTCFEHFRTLMRFKT